MNTHPEQELLSPFVDGELTEREQVTLEAHLASCEDCRSVLDVLRATLGDLTLLGEAVPSAQDSWALRSALAKERRLNRRGRRWYLISGGAAAALVGILAFALSTGSADRSGPGALQALDAAGGAGGPQLQFTGVNYNNSSAREILLGFSSTAPSALRMETRSATSTGSNTTERMTDGSFSGGGQAGGQPLVPDGRTLDQVALDRCVATVTSGSSRAMSPRHYEGALFDNAPAFLLIFEVPSMKRLELWVVKRETCDTLFFAQTQA